MTTELPRAELLAADETTLGAILEELAGVWRPELVDADVWNQQTRWLLTRTGPDHDTFTRAVIGARVRVILRRDRMLVTTEVPEGFTITHRACELRATMAREKAPEKLAREIARRVLSPYYEGLQTARRIQVADDARLATRAALARTLVATLAPLEGPDHPDADRLPSSRQELTGRRSDLSDWVVDAGQHDAPIQAVFRLPRSIETTPVRVEIRVGLGQTTALAAALAELALTAHGTGRCQGCGSPSIVDIERADRPGRVVYRARCGNCGGTRDLFTRGVPADRTLDPV